MDETQLRTDPTAYAAEYSDSARRAVAKHYRLVQTIALLDTLQADLADYPTTLRAVETLLADLRAQVSEYRTQLVEPTIVVRWVGRPD